MICVYIYLDIYRYYILDIYRFIDYVLPECSRSQIIESE